MQCSPDYEISSVHCLLSRSLVLESHSKGFGRVCREFESGQISLRAQSLARNGHRFHSILVTRSCLTWVSRWSALALRYSDLQLWWSSPCAPPPLVQGTQSMSRGCRQATVRNRSEVKFCKFVGDGESRLPDSIFFHWCHKTWHSMNCVPILVSSSPTPLPPWIMSLICGDISVGGF